MKKAKRIDTVFNEEAIISAISKFDVSYRNILKYLIITQGNILFPFIIVSKYLTHTYGDDYKLSEAYIRRYAITFICFWLYNETDKKFAYFKQLDNNVVDLTKDIQIDDFIITRESDKEIVEDLILYAKTENSINVRDLSQRINDIYGKFTIKIGSSNEDKIHDRINHFLDCGKEFYFMIDDSDEKEKDIYSKKGNCFGDRGYYRYDEVLASEYYYKQKELIKFSISINEENFELFEKNVCDKYSNADKKKLALPILGIIVYNVLNGYCDNNAIECPSSKLIKFYFNNKNYSLTKNGEFVLNCFDLITKEDERVEVVLKNKRIKDDFEFNFNGKKYSFNNLIGNNFN